jgi:hypothetical protein
MTPNSLKTHCVKVIRKVVLGAGLLLTVTSLFSPTWWGADASRFNRRSAEDANSLFVNEQKLTASDGSAFDEFGNSVAFSGSTMVVGAADGVDGNPDQGSAYVFNRQAGAWVEEQKLTASDGAADNFFGWSVAISDSTIVVGAWPDDIGANVDQGSAYVFNRVGGSWIETQKLTASDGTVGDHFGWSVAVSGSTIIVGALSDKIGANFFQGSAYVFDRHGESWVESQKLTGSDGRTIRLVSCAERLYSRCGRHRQFVSRRGLCLQSPGRKVGRGAEADRERRRDV